MSSRVHARLPSRPVRDASGRQRQARLGPAFGAGASSNVPVAPNPPEPRLVVVVEADEHARMLARLTLGEIADIVGGAPGDEALAALRARGGDVLLVRADLHLAGSLSSLDLARTIIERWPGTHTLLTPADPPQAVTASLPREPSPPCAPWGETDRVGVPA